MHKGSFKSRNDKMARWVRKKSTKAVILSCQVNSIVHYNR